MSARRVVLWRHGQTDWNVGGRFQGQEDIPLNAVGVSQAQAAAPHLAALGPSAIFSSDLGRAMATAQELAALVELPVVADVRLREVHVGEWSGLTSDEAFALDPAFKVALDGGEDYRRSPSGETAVELGARVAAAVDELAAAADDESTIVCVCHGLAIRMTVATMLGLDYAQSLLFSGPRNCSWSVLEPGRQTRWRLLAYNLTPPQQGSAGLTVDDAW